MIIPVGFAQINLKFTGSGLPTGAEVTLGANVNSYGEGVQALADEVHDAYAAHLADVAPGGVTLSEVMVKYGPNVSGPSAVNTDAVAGGMAASQLLTNVAILVRKQTNNGGRHGRGRTYLPFATEAVIDNGIEVSPAYLSDLQDGLDAFAAQLGGAGAPLYLLHADSTDPYPITNWSVQSMPATQRRRLRR